MEQTPGWECGLKHEPGRHRIGGGCIDQHAGYVVGGVELGGERERERSLETEREGEDEGECGVEREPGLGRKRGWERGLEREPGLERKGGGEREGVRERERGGGLSLLLLRLRLLLLLLRRRLLLPEVLEERVRRPSEGVEERVRRRPPHPCLPCPAPTASAPAAPRSLGASRLPPAVLSGGWRLAVGGWRLGYGAARSRSPLPPLLS